MFANLGGNMEWAFWGRWWGREDWQEECQSRQGFDHHHLNQQRPSKRMSRFFTNTIMPKMEIMIIMTICQWRWWWKLGHSMLQRRKRNDEDCYFISWKNARPCGADERWQQYFQETKTRRQRPGPPTLFHPLGHFCPGERYFPICSLIFFFIFLKFNFF